MRTRPVTTVVRPALAHERTEVIYNSSVDIDEWDIFVDESFNLARFHTTTLATRAGASNFGDGIGIDASLGRGGVLSVARSTGVHAWSFSSAAKRVKRISPSPACVAVEWDNWTLIRRVTLLHVL